MGGLNRTLLHSWRNHLICLNKSTDLLDRSSFAVTVPSTTSSHTSWQGHPYGIAISTGDCADDRRKNSSNSHWFFPGGKRIEQSSTGGPVVHKIHIGHPNAFAKTRRNAFRLKFRSASEGVVNLFQRNIPKVVKNQEILSFPKDAKVG